MNKKTIKNKYKKLGSKILVHLGLLMGWFQQVTKHVFLKSKNKDKLSNNKKKPWWSK